ncbi:sensor histidine kinase [Winogradskyella immobilis]|uniref:Oxygen sensor histidine kinase NreB n=1 Tax=Winogradskyella immobilis TaxID=2816852 RepID=A0ABS8EQB9_9FLAO|nr:sensor histidine kinase [Winogradskyella immobilis]MCC1484497.1 hypothetical protein [Winogradskyella immobilis]MCG0016589.1 sensor histidine kinase [Winogradskyella immobilis]
MSINYMYAQEFNYYIEKLKISNLDSVNNYKTNPRLNEEEKNYIQKQIFLIKKGEVTAPKKDNDNSILNNLLKGDYYLFKKNTNDSLSFNYYVEALKSSEEKNDTLLITESCRKIMLQLYKSRRAVEVYPTYLKIYKNFLYDNNEKANYIFYYYNHQTTITRIATINELKDGLKLAHKASNKYLQGKFNQLIGLFYQYYINELDSALTHQFKAKRIFEKKPYTLFVNELYGVNANIGLMYQGKGELDIAQSYFEEASKINIPNYKYLEKVKIRGLLATNYYLKKDYKKAYDYIIEQNKYLDTLNEYDKANKVNEINTKYKTAKKEKENLILESKRKRNQNIAIGLASSLALGSIIAFLLFKSTKRKQKLAEQEKEIETQKLTTVLKEQELNAIDAMIEGQEKERQRIANDLHDDLGGLMTTVKWHFNALKENGSTELYDKTNTLLDEAYQKIRSVSHAKNSGVIAKQGLLKAVKEMANKVSVANRLEIEVIDHGLENRLENSLELTIFRIIQELTANTIKHAQATETNIHITNHDDSLNIMVEDNGIGFNPNQITKTSKGMGISSIDKRVEHLNGKMTIESEIYKGTTIIIDIPL